MGDTLTDHELERVLLDPECPWGYALNATDRLPVQVTDLVAIARTRFPGAEHLEHSLDEYVVRVGGKRVGFINLNDLFQRAVRRLSGRETPPTSDIYEVPQSFFAARGRRDPRRARWEDHRQ